MTNIPDSESDEFTEEKEQALRDLPDKNERYKEPEDLPNWAKRAITLYELGNYNSVTEAAADHDRAKSTLNKYRFTPGGRQWADKISEVRDDPERMAEMMLRGSIHHFTADLMAMWEAAKDAGDYEWIRKAWKDITEGVAPQIAPKGSESADASNAAIQINFTSQNDLSPPKVEADFEQIDDATVEADYEVVDDDGSA